MVKIIECPRDAMQGLHEFIPTEDKIRYIQELLAVGFDTLDCGSFVNPRAIPQMADTPDVLSRLDLTNTKTKLLTIIANVRGAQDACKTPQVNCLGFPFSISDTFQLRNTNSTILESLERVKEIKKLCDDHNKELVVYLSMGFGNPYGDPWNVEIVSHWVKMLYDQGIRIISLSDTIGVSSPESIVYLFQNLIPAYPEIEFGAHLHTEAHNWEEKIDAAYRSGCRRFDGALKGYGGCPMAKNELIGNMPTEKMVQYFSENEIELSFHPQELKPSLSLLPQIFPIY
jgi:hydroxymethylglutaryl-CoA lyase